MKNISLSSALCLLCLLGCDQNPLLKRTGANYFPLDEGNTWIYVRSKKTEKDTITLKVISDTSIYARECWLLERNALPEYWWKDPHRLDKLYCETIFVNGEEDTVAIFWIPWLHLPLILHNRWNATFSQQKIILGDTVSIHIKIDSEVDRLNSSDYRVRINLVKSRKSKNFGSFSDTTTYYEWYSQDIGMTERTMYLRPSEKLIKEELISYSIK